MLAMTWLDKISKEWDLALGARVTGLGSHHHATITMGRDEDEDDDWDDEDEEE